MKLDDLARLIINRITTLAFSEASVLQSGHNALRLGEKADPRLLRNRIHDGELLAAMWTTTARGTLEDNDIFGNAISGVEINPWVTNRGQKARHASV
jgi:hypothetical protein